MKLMHLTGERLEEYFKLNDKFYEAFGDIIPSAMLEGVDFEHLKESVQKCFDAEKNLLPEIYELDDEVMY